jgi:hypothetical protein
MPSLLVIARSNAHLLEPEYAVLTLLGQLKVQKVQKMQFPAPGLEYF